MAEKKYIYFWGHKQGKYACMSNFYPKSFVFRDTVKHIPLNNDDVKKYLDNKQFNCTEQVFMTYKALLFANTLDRNSRIDNLVIARDIAKSTDPVEIKRLGRKVKGFDSKQWDAWKYAAMFNALYNAFMQNDEYLTLLLDVDGNFVEASPYDRIWGIGFREKEAEENMNKWGENLLGKCLDEVKAYIKNKSTLSS